MNFKKYKITVWAVVLLLLTLLFAITAYADNELPWVPIPTDQKPVSVKFSSEPNKKLYLVGEELDLSGARLELTYESGQKLPDIVKTEWCTGFDSTKVGKKTVTVTYPETSCTATFSVEVVTEDSLKIVKPSKLVYFVGEQEDRSGLTVSVVYSNGQTDLLESGYTVTGFSSNTIGEKTVTVKYKNLSATYKINVVEPALLMINIEKVPNKLSYYIGEVLDLSGIKVSAVYENGVVADVSSKILAEGDINSTGKKKITVIYSERDFIKTAVFEVSVTDVQIKNIAFFSYPNKTVYAEYEAFDRSGISIRVTYNNGESKIVSEDDIQYTGFDSNTVGKKTVTLHFGGYQLNFEVEVVVAASHIHKESEFKQTKAPTCTEPGEETTTCTVCFETVSRRYIPATGHGAESMPIQTKAPTCTDAGETATYCMVCGGVVTVGDIFPLGHTEGEMNIILPPTCIESGVSKSFCTVCSAEVTVLTIDPLGHNFGLWQMTLEPTGDAEGKEERFCAVCSFAESRALPKLEKILFSSDFTAQLNSSSSYFPYSSQFSAETVTGNLTSEELALLIPESEREKYLILEVFDFGFTNVLGERFLPKGEITYTVKYELPYGEYQSFLIFDSDYGIYTPVTSAESLSFTVERIGRFILVGELLPEPTVPETEETDDTSVGESTSGENSGINVSAPPVNGTSAVIISLVIIAAIFIVIIVALVYTYAFRQEY